MNRKINSIKIPIKVRIGEKRIKLKELLELKEGSILELNRNENDLIDLMVGEEIIAKGLIIEKEGKFAIQIKEIKENE